ncbi:hypothetical protein Bpfe_020009 [Biomphalaria pfeifferi]|uniref:Uncharacterized protein n=1 Tax=Biomphalaria pfeifferi TaxID=112525 RepID=A0AAD8F4Y8_BIOPF|nr:hypothetical protein Bpfe_020009 [Biomphalaria pfeifferi]
MNSSHALHRSVNVSSEKPRADYLEFNNLFLKHHPTLSSRIYIYIKDTQTWARGQNDVVLIQPPRHSSPYNEAPGTLSVLRSVTGSLEPPLPPRVEGCQTSLIYKDPNLHMTLSVGELSIPEPILKK